jgi:hypothetical protein
MNVHEAKIANAPAVFCLMIPSRFENHDLFASVPQLMPSAPREATLRAAPRTVRLRAKQVPPGLSASEIGDRRLHTSTPLPGSLAPGLLFSGGRNWPAPSVAGMLSARQLSEVSCRFSAGGGIDIGRPSEALGRPRMRQNDPGGTPGPWNVRSHAAVTPPIA